MAAGGPAAAAGARAWAVDGASSGPAAGAAPRSWAVFPDARGRDWARPIAQASGLLPPLVRLVQELAHTAPIEEAACIKRARDYAEAPLTVRSCCWAAGALWAATTMVPWRSNRLLRVYFRVMCAPPDGDDLRRLLALLPSLAPIDRGDDGQPDHDLRALVPSACADAPGAPCIAAGRDCAFGFWAWRDYGRKAYALDPPGAAAHVKVRVVLELPPEPAACPSCVSGIGDIVVRGADVCVAADGGWLVYRAGRPCARLAAGDQPMLPLPLCAASPRGMAALSDHAPPAPKGGKDGQQHAILIVRAPGVAPVTLDVSMADAVRLLPEPGGERVAVVRRSGRVDLLRVPF